MRTKSFKKTTTSKKILIVTAVLVGLISVFLILEATGATHFLSSFNSKTTDQIKEDEINSKNKQDFINSKTNNSNTDNNTVTEPTSNNISLSTRRETDGSVTILTELKKYSDGTCDLTINSGGNTYTKTAPVIYQSAFSTCAGFSIPANTLVNGTWQISLTVTSKGKANTKTISAEIQ